MTTGHSETPLVKRASPPGSAGPASLAHVLGAAADGAILTFGAPRAVVHRLHLACPHARIEAKPLAGVYSSAPSLFIGGFCFLRSELTRALPAFKRLLASGGTLWVFWPKPVAWDAEGIRPEAGITTEFVSDCAASLGLKGMTVYQLDPVWEGMKLVPAPVPAVP